MSGGDKHPCQGCGYMMSGGSMCGDCREYGPPRGWRWQYDPTTDRHTKVDYADAPASVPGAHGWY